MSLEKEVPFHCTSDFLDWFRRVPRFGRSSQEEWFVKANSHRMKLGISKSGIVWQREDGEVEARYPTRNGAPWRAVKVDAALADELRITSGDILDEGRLEDKDGEDEPVIAGAAGVNGLSASEALERPLPRPHRNSLEREAPEMPLTSTLESIDMTGRIIDFACPLGMGCAGLIYGPHGSGLTRALQTTAHAVTLNAQDIQIFILLLHARGEEATQWRRDFPAAEVIECPTTYAGATANETVDAASLVLQCAQRQTELGRHVFVAIDSLTALWAAMLEMEEADAQREADRAIARIEIRDWMLRAGNFAGEGLLGSGLGGSLTVVATAWHQEIDMEAEEEGETHPHLRLIEHVLNDANWRLKLSGTLAGQRLYPAVDLNRSISLYEASILTAKMSDRRSLAKSALLGVGEKERHFMLMEALEQTGDNESAVELLLPEQGEKPQSNGEDDFWAGWPAAD